MESHFRKAFNTYHSDDVYRRMLHELEATVGCPIQFRVAETPLFLGQPLRSRLERHAKEIAELAVSPAALDKTRGFVPSRFDTPGMDEQPTCLQVDFAITLGEDGKLDGKLVELQAFPSLYGLMVYQLRVTSDFLHRMPGLQRPWTLYFGGNEYSFVDHLRRAVVANERPEHVVLVDIDPPTQKTYPDFLATQKLLGVDPVCITELHKDGRELYRLKDGRRVPVRRIYNRIVFDELERRRPPMRFAFGDDLDVTWASHPNWYWPISKVSLPHLDHPAVPKARLISELASVPDDLSGYVLKPLFSFAGAGVNVDPTAADVARIPEADRSGWVLQEKIEYAPALPMPDGAPVKAEVRMMFLRAPGEPKLRLVLNLVRLSRGKMLGVDFNKDLTWVGGTVGIWPADE